MRNTSSVEKSALNVSWEGAHSDDDDDDDDGDKHLLGASYVPGTALSVWSHLLSP